MSTFLTTGLVCLALAFACWLDVELHWRWMRKQWEDRA